MGATFDGDNAEAKRKYLEYLADVFTYGAAARKLGVSIATIYNWRAADPVFREACENVRLECGDLVESTLYQKARDEGGMPAYFFLNGHKSDIYKGSRVDHSGAVKIEVVWETQPTPDELKAKE